MDREDLTDHMNLTDRMEHDRKERCAREWSPSGPEEGCVAEKGMVLIRNFIDLFCIWV